MGVECEKAGGVGHLYHIAMGGVIFSTGWPSCTPSPPPPALHRLFSRSVNGHLCVNNSTLLLLYRECLFEFQL